jgi:hypothetical protein
VAELIDALFKVQKFLVSAIRDTSGSGVDMSLGFRRKHNLKYPVPIKIGGTLSPSLLDPLLQLYEAARTNLSGPLTRAILTDLQAYDAAAARHASLAGPDVMARLAAAAAPAASDAMRLSNAKIEAMTVDATAPPSSALMHICYSQRIAADVSIAVYNLICIMIDAVNVGGYCLPGGVKGSRRVLFKSLFKYGCNLSMVHDLSRLTIKVPDLTAMATLVEALHAHSALLVTRCKNRFAADANTDDAGGYGARGVFFGGLNSP